jgi:peroxiredoxin
MADGEPGSAETLEEAFERARALPASLDQQLAAMTASFRRLRPRVTAAYDHLVARLQEARAGETAPAVGEPMPGFLLPDQDGRLLSLDELLASGPLVVSFNRGHWCQYCRLETRALGGAAAAIAAHGAGIVAITPERLPFAKRLRAEAGLGFPVLCDVDLGYALSLGLAIAIGEEIASCYREARIDLGLYQGSGGWLLPVPATFVVGQDGVVKARSVDPDFRRRMSVEDVLAALSALRRS